MRVSSQLARTMLIGSIVASSIALAQGNSVITGTVTDAATGQPVADVVVTATSPALQGEALVMTESTGLYRLAQLPAGVYTVSFQRESFRPFNRTEVSVRIDRTIRLNVQLQPESVESDTITVVGRPPTVDVGSTTTGLNVGKEFINSIAFIQPNSNGVRSFESLAAVAPQVIVDQYGFGFSGAQSPENLYLVDGVSTTDPAFGTNGAQFPVEFVEEANVITGGYQAEYGRATGGVLNVVTKSGSNEFHGSVWANWTPGALAGNPTVIKNDNTVFQFNTRPWNTVDLGADVGGPIVKDRLWFYVGFSPAFNRTRTERTVNRYLINAAGDNFQYDDEGFILSDELPGTRAQRFDDTRSFNYIAKLTFLINSDNNISLSVVGSPTTNEQPFSFNPRRSAGDWRGGFTDINNTSTVSLKYQGGFLDRHLLVDVTLGWFHIDTSSLPNDGSDINATPGLSGSGAPAVTLRRFTASAGGPWDLADLEPVSDEVRGLCARVPGELQSVDVRGAARPLVPCPVTGPGVTYTIGGAGFMNISVLDRLAGRASVTYLMRGLGHHIWKAGLDVEHTIYSQQKGYSGNVLLRETETTTGLRYDTFRNYGDVIGPDETVDTKVITSIPTSWGIGAYLQDSWAIMDLVTLNAGLRYETQQLFASDGSLGMTLNNMLSPRVGLIYDFTEQGRSKLFGNYSRFYQSVPLNLADRALTGESRFSRWRNRTPTATGPGCDPVADFNQVFNECNDPANYQVVGGPYDVTFSLANFSAAKTPVDPDLIPQSSDEIVVGGEYEVISDGRVGVTYTRRWLNEVIEDMSIDEGSTYFIGNPGRSLGVNFPRATRDYDAVTVYFNKAFSDGWIGQLSYTWSSLRGNHNGLFRPETGQLDPNINSDFDLVSLLGNRTGPLDADRTHFIKAYASKEFVITNQFAILASLTYEGLSGAPINYYGSHPLYGADEAFLLPRGSGGRVPFRHQVNAKVGLSYRFNKDMGIQFTTDVFNLFSFQAITAVDNRLTIADALPAVIASGSTGTAQEQTCLAGLDNPACAEGALPGIARSDDPKRLLTRAELNPNFKRPTAYQQPISVRFGIRFTF